MNILPLTYLGNVQFFTKLCFTECVVDVHEHYVKQSFRSRCEILAANGPVALVVNTVKGPNEAKLSVRDTRIDYSKRWQHQHWQSIVSAYRNSPFFDYYAHLFEPFYTKRFDFLFDLNAGLLQTAMRLLGFDDRVRFSEGYVDLRGAQAETTDGTTAALTDWRDALSHKPRLTRPDPEFRPEPYCQVFADRMEFVPNLSILDLLMCEGPAAKEVLRRSHLAPEAPAGTQNAKFAQWLS